MKNLIERTNINDDLKKYIDKNQRVDLKLYREPIDINIISDPRAMVGRYVLDENNILFDGQFPEVLNYNIPNISQMYQYKIMEKKRIYDKPIIYENNRAIKFTLYVNDFIDPNQFKFCINIYNPNKNNYLQLDGLNHSIIKSIQFLYRGVLIEEINDYNILVNLISDIENPKKYNNNFTRKVPKYSYTTMESLLAPIDIDKKNDIFMFDYSNQYDMLNNIGTTKNGLLDLTIPNSRLFEIKLYSKLFGIGYKKDTTNVFPMFLFQGLEIIIRLNDYCFFVPIFNSTRVEISKYSEESNESLDKSSSKNSSKRSERSDRTVLNNSNIMSFGDEMGIKNKHDDFYDKSRSKIEGYIKESNDKNNVNNNIIIDFLNKNKPKDINFLENEILYGDISGLTKNTTEKRREEKKNVFIEDNPMSKNRENLIDKTPLPNFGTLNPPEIIPRKEPIKRSNFNNISRISNNNDNINDISRYSIANSINNLMNNNKVDGTLYYSAEEEEDINYINNNTIIENSFIDNQDPNINDNNVYITNNIININKSLNDTKMENMEKYKNYINNLQINNMDTITISGYKYLISYYDNYDLNHYLINKHDNLRSNSSGNCLFFGVSLTYTNYLQDNNNILTKLNEEKAIEFQTNIGNLFKMCFISKCIKDIENLALNYILNQINDNEYLFEQKILKEFSDYNTKYDSKIIKSLNSFFQLVKKEIFSDNVNENLIIKDVITKYKNEFELTKIILNFYVNMSFKTDMHYLNLISLLISIVTKRTILIINNNNELQQIIGKMYSTHHKLPIALLYTPSHVDPITLEKTSTYSKLNYKLLNLNTTMLFGTPLYNDNIQKILNIYTFFNQKFLFDLSKHVLNKKIKNCWNFQINTLIDENNYDEFNSYCEMYDTNFYAYIINLKYIEKNIDLEYNQMLKDGISAVNLKMKLSFFKNGAFIDNNQSIQFNILNPLFDIDELPELKYLYEHLNIGFLKDYNKYQNNIIYSNLHGKIYSFEQTDDINISMSDDINLYFSNYDIRNGDNPINKRFYRYASTHHVFTNFLTEFDINVILFVMYNIKEVSEQTATNVKAHLSETYIEFNRARYTIYSISPLAVPFFCLSFIYKQNCSFIHCIQNDIDNNNNITCTYYLCLYSHTIEFYDYDRLTFNPYTIKSGAIKKMVYYDKCNINLIEHCMYTDKINDRIINFTGMDFFRYINHNEWFKTDSITKYHLNSLKVLTDINLKTVVSTYSNRSLISSIDFKDLAKPRKFGSILKLNDFNEIFETSIDNVCLFKSQIFGNKIATPNIDEKKNLYFNVNKITRLINKFTKTTDNINKDIKNNPDIINRPSIEIKNVYTGPKKTLDEEYDIKEEIKVDDINALVGFDYSNVINSIPNISMSNILTNDNFDNKYNPNKLIGTVKNNLYTDVVIIDNNVINHIYTYEYINDTNNVLHNTFAKKFIDDIINSYDFKINNNNTKKKIYLREKVKHGKYVITKITTPKLNLIFSNSQLYYEMVLKILSEMYLSKLINYIGLVSNNFETSLLNLNFKIANPNIQVFNNNILDLNELFISKQFNPFNTILEEKYISQDIKMDSYRYILNKIYNQYKFLLEEISDVSTNFITNQQFNLNLINEQQYIDELKSNFDNSVFYPKNINFQSIHNFISKYNFKKLNSIELAKFYDLNIFSYNVTEAYIQTFYNDNTNTEIIFVIYYDNKYKFKISNSYEQNINSVNGVKGIIGAFIIGLFTSSNVFSRKINNPFEVGIIGKEQCNINENVEINYRTRVANTIKQNDNGEVVLKQMDIKKNEDVKGEILYEMIKLNDVQVNVGGDKINIEIKKDNNNDNNDMQELVFDEEEIQPENFDPLIPNIINKDMIETYYNIQAKYNKNENYNYSLYENELLLLNFQNETGDNFLNNEIFYYGFKKNYKPIESLILFGPYNKINTPNSVYKIEDLEDAIIRRAYYDEFTPDDKMGLLNKFTQYFVKNIMKLFITENANQNLEISNAILNYYKNLGDTKDINDFIISIRNIQNNDLTKQIVSWIKIKNRPLNFINPIFLNSFLDMITEQKKTVTIENQAIHKLRPYKDSYVLADYIRFDNDIKDGKLLKFGNADKLNRNINNIEYMFIPKLHTRECLLTYHKFINKVYLYYVKKTDKIIIDYGDELESKITNFLTEIYNNEIEQDVIDYAKDLYDLYFNDNEPRIENITIELNHQDRIEKAKKIADIIKINRELQTHVKDHIGEKRNLVPFVNELLDRLNVDDNLLVDINFNVEYDFNNIMGKVNQLYYDKINGINNINNKLEFYKQQLKNIPENIGDIINELEGYIKLNFQKTLITNQELYDRIVNQLYKNKSNNNDNDDNENITNSNTRNNLRTGNIIGFIEYVLQENVQIKLDNLQGMTRYDYIIESLQILNNEISKDLHEKYKKIKYEENKTDNIKYDSLLLDVETETINLINNNNNNTFYVPSLNMIIDKKNKFVCNSKTNDWYMILDKCYNDEYDIFELDVLKLNTEIIDPTNKADLKRLLMTDIEANEICQSPNPYQAILEYSVKSSLDPNINNNNDLKESVGVMSQMVETLVDINNDLNKLYTNPTSFYQYPKLILGILASIILNVKTFGPNLNLVSLSKLNTVKTIINEALNDPLVRDFIDNNPNDNYGLIGEEEIKVGSKKPKDGLLGKKTGLGKDDLISSRTLEILDTHDLYIKDVKILDINRKWGYNYCYIELTEIIYDNPDYKLKYLKEPFEFDMSEIEIINKRPFIENPNFSFFLNISKQNIINIYHCIYNNGYTNYPTLRQLARYSRQITLYGFEINNIIIPSEYLIGNTGDNNNNIQFIRYLSNCFNLYNSAINEINISLDTSTSMYITKLLYKKYNKNLFYKNNDDILLPDKYGYNNEILGKNMLGFNLEELNSKLNKPMLISNQMIKVNIESINSNLNKIDVNDSIYNYNFVTFIEYRLKIRIFPNGTIEYLN